MSIRTRLAELVGGGEWHRERANLQKSMAELWGAYLDGPYQLPPDELIRQLSEYDSAILHDLVLQLEWDKVGAYAQYNQDYEAARGRSVQECRRLWQFDPLAAWIVNTWTNFGFGENIIITPNDEAAQDVWKEFWTSDRNEPILGDDNLHELSDTVLVDGEMFFPFYIALDGAVTIRTFATDEVSEIITLPDDKRVPIFYKRTYTDPKGKVQELYYPDITALMLGDEYANEMEDFIKSGRFVRADEVSDTKVGVLHVAHNRKGTLRGWPIMSTGTAWVRAHKQFRENRATVAAAVAMYINKLKVQGGSRAVDAVKLKLQSALNSNSFTDTNPPAAAGSTWLENQAADLTRMPLTTGAGDAKTDGEALLQMVGLSGGLFPHWLGAGDAYRLATASAMETPILRGFSRYQQFWATQFRRMVRVVLWASNEYGNTSFDDLSADVNIDRLLETDIVAMTSNTTSYMAQVAAMASANLMPEEEAKRTVNFLNRNLLEAYGNEDVNEIAPQDETYLNAPAPEPTPPTPAQPAPGDEQLPAVMPTENAKRLAKIASLRERVLKLTE